MARHAITVIVPTYNRPDTLRLCLQALEGQTMRDFEVIVVDDGSTDNTWDSLQTYVRTTTLSLRILRQLNSGPAKARNHALTQCEAPLAITIGDDILASPSFVETHLRFHVENVDEDAFALGLTRWDAKHQVITPFMRWFEKIQFDYDNLLRGGTADWRHAYTSNLSFKVALLLKNRFSEAYRYAACEDMELAYRLHRRNQFKLTFLPEAFATHIHPTTMAQAIRRAEVVGAMTRLFYEQHPEARPMVADAASRVCSYLGRHPGLLVGTTRLVCLLPKQTKLHSMILRAHAARQVDSESSVR